MYTLGIDLGTSSVKVLAMDEKGQIKGEAGADYPLLTPRENYAEQDPEKWWKKTGEAVRKLISENNIPPNEVKAIGFSGQMHGLVALDEKGKVLLPAILWCDQRTEKECREITDYFGEKGLLKEVGNRALTGFTAPKILWVKKNHPEIFEKISHILLPKDYMGYRLTGNYATDYSDASGMLLLDVKHKKWSRKMMEFLGIEKSMLPELYESSHITGKLTPKALSHFGLEGDVFLVAGAGDQAAGAIGTGTVEEGIISVSMGTSGVVFAAHNKFLADSSMRLHSFCHSTGKYHTMGVMLSCASCIKWWQENVHDKYSIDQLIEETKDVPPGGGNVIFLPYLMGERTPHADPNARGTFCGITAMTTRKEMTKALLEGICFGLKDTFEIIREMGIPVNEVRVIGGGTKNPEVLRILSDILGVCVNTINTSQGGALGAAILAATGASFFTDVVSASKSLIQKETMYCPDEKNMRAYEKIYPSYRSCYTSLKYWFKSRETI